VNAPDGHENSERAADEEEQHTLGEQLTNQTLAAGTEREANGHLFLPSGGTRQHQAGDTPAAMSR